MKEPTPDAWHAALSVRGCDSQIVGVTGLLGVMFHANGCGEANALLAAAAPELFAFGKRALRGLEAIEQSRGEPTTDEQRAAVVELRAMIAAGRAAIAKGGGK